MKVTAFLFLVSVISLPAKAYQFYQTQLEFTLTYTDIESGIHEEVYKATFEILFSKENDQSCLVVSPKGKQPCPFKIDHEHYASYSYVDQQQFIDILDQYAQLVGSHPERTLMIIEHGQVKRGERNTILLPIAKWYRETSFYDGTTVQFHVEAAPYESVHLTQRIGAVRKIN